MSRIRFIILPTGSLVAFTFSFKSPGDKILNTYDKIYNTSRNQNELKKRKKNWRLLTSRVSINKKKYDSNKFLCSFIAPSAAFA